MMRNRLSNPARRLIALFAVTLLIGISLPLTAFASTYSVVTFVENDNSSDNVVASQPASGSEALTLFSSLSPAMTDPGHVFVNWNTESNGGGTSYSDGATYDFSDNLVLYAQWSSDNRSVTFAENASVTDSVVSQQIENAATPLTQFSVLSPAFTKNGFTFTGWNTSADGTGTTYQNGAAYGFGSNLTLYAQWTENTTTTTTTTSTTTTTLPLSMFTVSFNDGGGTGMLNAVTVTSGSSVQLPNSGSLTYQGFAQTGWFTASTGGTSVGLGGASFIPTSSITLYAQWVAGVAVTTSFSANGGTGTIASISSPAGSSLTLPTGLGLLDTGFVFSGWSPSSTSQSMVYSPGAPYLVASGATLYAVWTVAAKAPVVSRLAGAVGPFVQGSSVLGTTLKSQIHNIASGMKTRDYASTSMFGYALANEKGAHANTLSARRATAVENYLRGVLVSMHVEPVLMHATGEALVKGTSNTAFRRVEVFVKL
jgi:uncharacterized repeat protein (TIGR02543 family)